MREVGRSAITAMRRSASAKKVAFSDALMESIFEDIERGEPGGSYYLDGQRAVRGYVVGGYEGGFRRAEEFAVSRDDIEDEQDLRAVVELMDEEARRLMSGGDVVVGFWVNDRGQVVCSTCPTCSPTSRRQSRSECPASRRRYTTSEAVAK